MARVTARRFREITARTAAERYPAKTVAVVKIFRAHCDEDECSETRFGEYATAAEASAERERHLAAHRQAWEERDG